MQSKDFNGIGKIYAMTPNGPVEVGEIEIVNIGFGGPVPCGICPGCQQEEPELSLDELIGQAEAAAEEDGGINLQNIAKYLREVKAQRIRMGQVMTALEMIEQNDKTESEYGDRRRCDNEKPPGGQRWLSPREIARGLRKNLEF